jgi:hypothetical protein
VICKLIVTLELQHVAGGEMSTSEHDAIKAIADDARTTRELMQTIAADMRVLKTKLLGDDENELPTGRIPILESEVSALKTRMDRLTRLSWIASGFLLCLNVIGWLFNIASHITGAFKR